MPSNSTYMRLIERGDLDRERQERRARGRMPMEGLRCSFGEVVDLSPSGVCIRRRSLLGLKKGSPVVLVFRREDEKFAVKAKVVRVIKDSLLVRRYGMQFINLSPKQSTTLMQLAKDCRPQLMISATSAA